MCEYCTEEYYKRNSYKLKGDLDNPIEIDLLISSKDELYISAKWFDDIRNCKMGMASLAKIRYCPWCGRKLED